MSDVKVIAVTHPLITNDGIVRERDAPYVPMSAEEFIAYTARVSNPSNQSNTLTAPKLLKYLIKNKHWSPFEMVGVCMEINTTRDIAHQILRHRSFSFQEFSQRYADPTKDIGFTYSDARLQDKKNRQNSIEFDDKEIKGQWIARQQGVMDVSAAAYRWATENGIAKEVSRKVLPEGLTNTRLYMSGTLRSWIHYIDVREPEGTQKEHRIIAQKAQEEILKYFPSLEEYWKPEPEIESPSVDELVQRSWVRKVWSWFK